MTELVERNQEFYDSVWRRARLQRPELASTWPRIEELVRDRDALLEIGPGMRPRLPLGRAKFLDASEVAAHKLRDAGADVQQGDISSIPFADASFDLVCALDVIEHAEDPRAALAEVRRVLRPGARLIFSVPMFADQWTPFDQLVGHKLRFDPEDLAQLLCGHGLDVVESARFSSLPRARLFLHIGTWTLRWFRRPAVWLEDRIVQPLQRRWQSPLSWQPGLVVPDRVDGLIVHCRLVSR